MRIYQAEVRAQAEYNKPLRGEQYQIGFYDAGVMRSVLDYLGEGSSYKVWSLPIPQTEHELEYAKRLLTKPSVQYSLVNKDKIVYVTVEHQHDYQYTWLEILNEIGYEVHSGPKTNKRLKSFHRPTLLNADFEHLNVVYVEPDEYSKYDFTNSTAGEAVSEIFTDPEVFERLLDGGFIISNRLVQQAVLNIPSYQENDDDENDYYYDPYLRSRIVEDLLQSRVFNTRIIFKDGFLKGNAISCELPEGVDVITAKCNVKKEITYKNYRFLAEPQESKTKVITDLQTVINFPKLFDYQDMEYWLTNEYDKMFDDATNNRILTNWKYIYQRMWKDDQDINENEARAKMAYVAYRWTSLGFNLTDSPWLFETTAISHARPLLRQRGNSKNKVGCIPIPCSIYEQIIPESLARMAGYDIEVEEGTIARINEIGMHVVDDLDWLEMYESHGGHDEDDFFKLFYRTFEGGDYNEEKVVIAIRSPNGYGEYSIFRYVEGNWSPTWYASDGTEVKFPIVNGNDWPQRLSSAIHSKKVLYSGLPSESKPAQKRTGLYLPDDVVRDIEIAKAGGNVGAFVNACMIHSSTIAQHRPNQLCSLEQAIDKCINPDDVQDVTAIDSESKNMIREVVNSKIPVDKFLWENKGSRRALNEHEVIELHDGLITKMQLLCFTKNSEYVKRVRSWAQQNCRPPKIVSELGLRLHYRALPHLNKFRSDVYSINSGEVSAMNGFIAGTNWDTLYDTVVESIIKHEHIQDVYDFVLGFYSATISTPTTGGKITDQIVMNNKVFPILEEALQYYGVALIPMYKVVNGKPKIVQLINDEWWYPGSDGELVKYDDPLEFQKAHAVDSPIVFTMPHINTEKRTRSAM